MYAISTSAFVFILALASSLVVVQAGDPRPKCWLTSSTVAGVTTCRSIGKEFYLTDDQLLGMNQDKTINCNAPLPAEILCVATMATAPVCAHKVTAPDADCSKFLSQYSLSKEDFFAYNDDVDIGCTNLKQGNNYCVSVVVEA